MKYRIIILFSLIIALCPSFARGIEVTKMTCELSEAPLTIDTEHPRFGWQLQSKVNGTRQSAYAIELYNVDNGRNELVWTSGKIVSNKSQLVPYSGSKKLERTTKYVWRVMVWDENNKPSSWSRKAEFRLAPSAAFLNAKWIGFISREKANLPSGRHFHSTVLKKPENKALWAAIDSASSKSVYLLRSFNADKKITQATAYVCGLGHYEFSLNGKKIGDGEFTPLISDYDKTVYYNVYDVTANLRKGGNAIGILLGNGFYNVQGGGRYRKLQISFGPPTLFFKMVVSYADGTTKEILSGADWKYSFSPIIFNSIYGGEDYNACLEQKDWNKPGFNDSRWLPVVVQSAPKGELRPQQAPSVKIMEHYGVKSVNKLSDKYVLDMGQNLSGFPEITVNGKRGTTIRLTVGESLNPDGTVSQKHTGSKHYYEYTLKGEGDEYWHPRFSYYGFRYIQVEGARLKEEKANCNLPLLKKIQSCFVYNSAEEVGDFNCSNKIFNDAHRIICMAMRSNMQGVFTDCPHREKLGWLEETHLNGPGLFFNYNLTKFIPKIMQDMTDAQHSNGLVPSIAPEYVEFEGDFQDSPEWGSASVILPWMYYDYYGDNSLIIKYYPTMKRYVDYLTSRADNHIVSHGLGDWYDYDGKKAGFSRNTPIPLVGTAHYLWDIQLLSRAADMVGNKEDEAHYAELAKQVKKEYNDKFFNAATRQYGNGSQCSNALPLFLDIVEPQYKADVLANLVKDIKAHGNRLTTGDVGNRYLFQTLARNGLNDVMYQMNNHEDAPGYGFQVKFGATTLTEQWDPREGTSWNHFMMGQIDEWFYTWLAGIQPVPSEPGFQKLVIAPQVVGDLKHVSASYNTLYGKVAVNWKVENGVFTMNVEVPVNCSATIILPNKEKRVMESGKQTFTVNI
nr:glycoside hydrolase family 78 protein [uncultured Bacteroides sp.]